MPIELITTDGIFSLDGEDFDVTNNIWLLGNDSEVLVVDAAHDASAIVDAVAGRRVRTILLTHGHNDHINAAVALSEAVDAPIALHPEDTMLWSVVYPDRSPDLELAHGQTYRAGGHEVAVLHTPGHAPGCCCFFAENDSVVFSGDTLFCGGPGATGRSFSDAPTLLRSIRAQLLALPPETVVHTGHGDSTTVGAEAPLIEELLRSAEGE
jgi:glyoxylase-like metal-dependent hydrolase (beta-lactamase superfamily II)